MLKDTQPGFKCKMNWRLSLIISKVMQIC